MNHNDSFGMGIPSFFKKWFAFVAFLALLSMGGTAYVLYLLLVHFGVVA